MIRPEEKQIKQLEFVDNGFSGSNLDRAAFQRMMDQVERGKITKIIVYKLDRISRSLADFVGILSSLKTHGVEFVSSQEMFDTSTPYGEMIVKILMVFAEFERQSIVERVTQAYSHRSELGFYMGGRKPYGFTLQETVIHNVKTKMLTPDVKEAEEVKYIFDAYTAPEISLRRLADDLICKKIVPSEGGWSAAKLSTILKNPIYVRADNEIYEYYLKHNAKIVSDISAFDGAHGLQIYGKTKHSADDFSDMKVVVMPHVGLIPSETWLQCQKKLEKNRKIGNAIRNTTSWLGGSIACKKCGRTMTVTKGAKRKDGTQTRYFSCTGKSHNRICGGPKVTVYADCLEEAVYVLLAEKLAEMKTVKRQVPANHIAKMNDYRNKSSEVKKQQKHLADLLSDPALERDLLHLMNERAKKLAEQQKDLLHKMERLESEQTQIFAAVSMTEKWKKAGYEERKAVCRTLIHRILIWEDGTTEVIWNI